MFGYDDLECADCGEEFEGSDIAFEIEHDVWVCEKCFKKYVVENMDMYDIAEAFDYKTSLAKDLRN